MTAPWWQARRSELLALAAAHTPRYAYDLATVRAQAAALATLGADRVLYAMKANPQPAILRTLAAAGLGFECVAPGELARVREVLPDLPRERVLFTPNFAPRAEYDAAFDAGYTVTLDDLHPLARWGDSLRGKRIALRFDPGAGAGHHPHVHTAGDEAKFGIPLGEATRAARLAAACGAAVVGLHAHAGSGITDSGVWAQHASVLRAVAAHFPAVEWLDLGGGLGLPERTGAPALDLAALARVVRDCKAARPDLAVWFEPGRWLVAQAGVLLARVTQLKTKGPPGEGVRFVGCDAGMNSLIRPALYGAQHPIVNLTRLGHSPGPAATVVGPICESADVLGQRVALPAATDEGDVLLLADAGAYGAAMSSRYNLREPADEVVLPER